MIEERVETVVLENGLNLEIYNKSRAVAGDTWLVAALFSVKILVDESLFEGVDGTPEASEVIGKLGDSVIFEVLQERNFINVAEKDLMFKTLKESYLKNTLSYLSHPKFGVKYVLKKFNQRVKY